MAFEKLVGGKADGKPDSAFSAKALARGMKVEREHSTNTAVTREIAKDHLSEDPRYYEKLEKMEKKAVTQRWAFLKSYYGAAKASRPRAREFIESMNSRMDRAPLGHSPQYLKAREARRGAAYATGLSESQEKGAVLALERFGLISRP